MKIRKALITSAGFGTRFLPITKTIQKEMLPILHRPLIDYIVEDCVKAGITEIIFVVNEHNSQVLHFYRENLRLKEYLKRMDKSDRYEEVEFLHQQAKFSFIRQTESDDYGTAIPVKLAKELLKNEEAFLVLMGDDFIYNSDRSSEIKKMIDLFESSQAHGLVTCIEKPVDMLYKYGVASTKKTGKFTFLNDIVEKPEPGTAPSNLVNISKYIFTPEIFDIIEHQKLDNKSGELYITDSATELAKQSSVVIHTPEGKYLDGGYPLGWLIANLTAAKDDPELLEGLREFFRDELASELDIAS